MIKVFISYSHKDKDWVCGWLMPRLEKAGILVHIDFRDFEIGVASILNMERAVEKCAKTILVLTPRWIESNWTQFEALMLQSEDPINLNKRILPLMLEDCQLPARLAIFTYADFRKVGNWDGEFSRVLKEIVRDRKSPSDSEFSQRVVTSDRSITVDLPLPRYAGISIGGEEATQRKNKGIVSLHIDNISIDELSDTHKSWLKFAIAEFLKIPPSEVRIAGAEAAESVRVKLEIPEGGIEALLKALAQSHPRLAKSLAPLKIAHVERETGFKQADFAIITALEKEAKAVVKRLTNHWIRRFEREDIRTYHCGTVGISGTDWVYRVVVVLLPNIGKIAAANAVTDVVRRWSPRFILAVGIAGGTPREGLELGDVVVADQIVGYDYGKVVENEIHARDRVYPASRLLLDRVRNFWDDTWKAQIHVARPQGTLRNVPKVLVGPIASGDKVVASRDFRESLRRRWSKLLAVEMEAEGVFAGVFDRPEIPSTLVIRAISDMADERKSDEWQEYAADAAATFAISFLQSGPVQGLVTLSESQAASPQTVRKEVEVIKPVRILCSKVPTTGKQFCGRGKVLHALDKAWADDHIHIVTLVAWGGMGKTALVNEWVRRMELDNWRGAQRVYAWSFYSQGTREDRQASGDEFLAHALKWFGDPNPTLGSPWDKGVRLAELLRKQRTLLILDGLEPLQYPPGLMHGRLRDQGLQALFKELVSSNPGLCIVTTREKVEDIDHAEGLTLMRIFLENLSPESCVELLRTLGVKGTDKELEKAVGEFAGHALGLNLLGTYLATVYDGDICKRDLVPRLMDEQEQGGTARRMMESYEIWLRGTVELRILYLLGLFDRPAPSGAIAALLAEPPIGGFTDKLQGLAKADWQYALKHLRELGLLVERDETDPGKLDCHPLIREHFGQKLKVGKPEAWRQAHSRLYEYYRHVPEKKRPDTLEEMEPLFCAVTHACHMGQHQEVLEEIYKERIARRKSAFTYLRDELGASGADLALLSSFFERAWQEPVAGLTEGQKAFVFAKTGLLLSLLCRFKEAHEPMQLALESYTRLTRWGRASQTARHLSRNHLSQGQLSEAEPVARNAVKLAEWNQKPFSKMGAHAILGHVLHQMGRLAEAGQAFREAECAHQELIKQRKEPDRQYLRWLHGFRHYDFLLSVNEYRKVIDRGKVTLKWLDNLHFRLGGALHRLALGQAHLIEALHKKASDFSEAARWIQEGVKGLHNAQQPYQLPRGYIARGSLRRIKGQFEQARSDLSEALEIAERGGKQLFITDCRLESARLCLAEGKKEEARGHWEEAAKQVEEMGYHRRDPEVLLIEAELQIVEGDKKAAEATVKKAKARIDKMGCRRWDVEVERLNRRLNE